MYEGGWGTASRSNSRLKQGDVPPLHPRFYLMFNCDQLLSRVKIWLQHYRDKRSFAPTNSAHLDIKNNEFTVTKPIGSG